jgi:hypothetical protein
MADRWRTKDGRYCVDVITLSATPNNCDGTWLRVREHGFWVADVRDPDELARFVPLEELEEGLATLPHPWLP